MIYSFLSLDSIDYKNWVIVFDCLLYCIAYCLNYRQHRRYLIRDRPNEWIDVVTAEEFKKTQSYNLDKSRFTFLQDLVKQGTIVLFWYYDGCALIWDISGYLLGLCGADRYGHQIIQALVYNILFSWGSKIALLPFSMYSVFVLDRKHGFDKSTLRSFCYEIYMNERIILEFMTPILAVSLWISLCVIRYSGDNFFIYIIIISLVIDVPSTFGCPLFTELKRLDDGDLQCKIETLAVRVGFPLKNIYVVDGSRAMNDHSKAYTYGFGRNQHIVLYDILLDELDNDEVCAIIAHELGHWKTNIKMKKFILCQLDSILMFWLLSFFIINNDRFYRSFGFSTTPIYIGYTIFQAFYAPIKFVINFLSSTFVRRDEYKADTFALDLGCTSKLRSALIKSSATKIDGLIDRYNMDSWYSTCHNECPTLTERLDRLDINPTSNTPIVNFKKYID